MTPLPHDTPVEVPRVDPLVEEAQRLQRMGYRAGVVARKLIDQHGAPADQAEAIASAVFGRPADARAGEHVGALLSGVAMIVGGLVVAGVLFSLLGVRRATLLPLGVALGLAGWGLERVIVAAVNTANRA